MATPQAAWTRAVLTLCLLGVLDREGPSYGYALLGRLHEAGLDAVKPATLYPALTRLAEEGAVDVRWTAGEQGPGRKYYGLTDEGRRRLAEQRAAWTAFHGTVTRLAGEGGGEGPAAEPGPGPGEEPEGDEA
ncbi:PadR family transcriptional regulator [Streptomyces mobaraensis]|uniref:PadR family transcriptional regulator n=1 Tax=Streptomyces mobaraensis TaxID=35621 RepID=A0A5N5WHM7_STRMB|nr:PadR family transcriptional regulator [Streptomyces mobaraensis]KAB7852729.1 PadR family transcriptional regulator [Streptomyces mobaraensis]